MSCGVVRRPRSDPPLLWLWCRPAATAPIRPLAREPPCAARVTQEMAKKDQKKKKEKKRKSLRTEHWGIPAFRGQGDDKELALETEKERTRRQKEN